MKFTWEESDIICGRIVCKHPSYNQNKTFEPGGNTVKWIYKIGFYGFGGKNNYVLICMADGMVMKPRPVKEIVEYLNECEMIPMPHAWLIKTFVYMRDWYKQ